MVFGKIKDIIKKRREENEQREATSTGFKTVADYNKWKQETRIKARERIVHTSQKKKKQRLKEKIEKSESNRNNPILETYVDAFDKIGKGVDKFQKGMDKFEKGIGQLEDGLNPSTKRTTRKPKRRLNGTRTIYRNPPKRRTRLKTKSYDDGFGWLEGNTNSKKSSRKKKDDGWGWLEN